MYRYVCEKQKVLIFYLRDISGLGQVDGLRGYYKAAYGSRESRLQFLSSIKNTRGQIQFSVSELNIRSARSSLKYQCLWSVNDRSGPVGLISFEGGEQTFAFDRQLRLYKLQRSGPVEDTGLYLPDTGVGVILNKSTTFVTNQGRCVLKLEDLRGSAVKSPLPQLFTKQMGNCFDSKSRSILSVRQIGHRLAVVGLQLDSGETTVQGQLFMRARSWSDEDYRFTTFDPETGTVWLLERQRGMLVGFALSTKRELPVKLGSSLGELAITSMFFDSTNKSVRLTVGRTGSPQVATIDVRARTIEVGGLNPSDNLDSNRYRVILSRNANNTTAIVYGSHGLDYRLIELEPEKQDAAVNIMLPRGSYDWRSAFSVR